MSDGMATATASPADPPWPYASVQPACQGGDASARPNLRRELHALLDVWRPHANRRTKVCGRVRHSLAVQVQLRAGRASLSGLIRCRSKGCPVCLCHRRVEDADAIKRVVERWRAKPGHRAYLMTLTVRHGMPDRLSHIGHAIRRAWSAFIGGRQWQSFRSEAGCEYIVAEEITHGEHGWHPHLHVLLLTPHALTDYLATADAFSERWARMVRRHLGDEHEPDAQHGVDLRPIDANCDYISKLGLELSAPGTKTGKGRSPITLLRDYAATGAERDLDLYREYAAVMRGRRDLTWSGGLKRLREQAAEERAAEAKREDAPQLVAELSGDDWDWWRDQASAVPSLLESAERGGWEAVRALFAARGRHLSTRPRA